MTAPARRAAAPAFLSHRPSARVVQQWHRAVEVRHEWLGVGLATAPADRPAVEHLICRIYARHGRSRPRFHWVDSPCRALPLVTGLPTHDELHRWVLARRPAGSPPLASDIAAGLARLRGALDEAADHPDLDSPPWRPPAPKGGAQKVKPVLTHPPLEALDAGVSLREVLRHGVRGGLQLSLAEGFAWPVRAALGAPRTLPVCWYGQQDAAWIAYYDALGRGGLAVYRPSDAELLADWAALARACGWWWPGEQVCVVAERPAVLRTEPVPGGWYEQVRPARGAQAPIRFRDGWCPPV